MAGPQVSLLSRIVSAIFGLLSIIFLLNLLRYRGTAYHLGYQRIPIYNVEDNLGRIIGWHFATSISFLSVGLLATLLILCAQLGCAARWTLERTFLISLHVFVFLCYFLVGIILIVWLISDSSPSWFDNTQAGPSASGLTITSCICSFISAALMMYGLCIIKVYRAENQKQRFIFAPSTTVNRNEINKLVEAVETENDGYHQRQTVPYAESRENVRHMQPPRQERHFDHRYAQKNKRHEDSRSRHDYAKGVQEKKSRRSHRAHDSRQNHRRKPRTSSRHGLPNIGERHYTSHH